MKKYLKEIATIVTGHVFRSKIDYTFRGNVNLLNMDSISTTGRVALRESDTMCVREKGVKPDEIVTTGKILFKAKGLNNTAVFVETIPKNTTVTSSCHIIEVTDKTVLAEYLCLWLNSNAAKKHFSKNAGQATGVTIANVSKATLENLEVIIPPLEEQRLLVTVENCAKQEHELRQQITTKKAMLHRAVIEQELKKHYKKLGDLKR